MSKKEKQASILTKEDVIKLFRFEDKKGFTSEEKWNAEVDFDEPIGFKFADLRAAFTNYIESGLTPQQFHERWYVWFDPYCGILEESYFADEDKVSPAKGLNSDAAEFYDILGTADEFYYEQDGIKFANELIGFIDKAVNRKGTSPLTWDLMDYEKSGYINYWDRGKLLDNASELELELFKNFVGEFYKKGDSAAMYAVAYGCYGGNVAFECDWGKSEEALLKIIESGDENPFIANTLGYIYYYGRTSDGNPQYDKAFRYFSIGAAGGVYESKYKLADMFRHGYFVEKNNQICHEIINGLYTENLNYIAGGHFNCKFGDIALRMGSMLLDTKDGEAQGEYVYELAYHYFLQAEYAIRMRMQTVDYFGDIKVYDGIKKSIADCKEHLPQSDGRKKTVYRYIGDIVSAGLLNNHRMKMEVKELANGKYSLKFSAVKRGDEKYGQKLFLTLPELNFCGLIDSIKVKYKPDMKQDFKEGTVVFDEIKGNVLLLYGEKAASIPGEFKVVLPKAKEEKTYRMAAVCFGGNDRLYDYICKDEDINAGDFVIVDSEFSDDAEVKVMQINYKKESELPIPLKAYKKVLRKKQ